jgi:hypothetical protein
MKLFSSLVFAPKPYMDGTHAERSFPNNYGVSVITGGYSSKAQPYEVAILHHNKITYTSGLTEDVIGYLTAGDVDKLMHAVKALPVDHATPLLEN